jgi:TonB-linked SusC/RagA family outer membrane protein
MKKNRLFQVAVLMLPLLMLSIQGLAQNVTVRGIVRDEAGAPLVGVNVFVDGTTIGVATNIDGSYQLNVSPSQTITYQYLGYEEQSEAVGDRRQINVTLLPSAVAVDEVVVVGFGQQKKASVVGAITQTTGEVLQRAAGQTNLGAALTGNLPGVVTVQGSGMPGEDDPQITVRAASSWNSSEPLILVDGIERPMSAVDVSSVESISVLKDASATAVYGVKGANGVILITTRRGQEGRAQINVGFTATMKTVSKLPNKYDSYDAMMLRNVAIENELALNPGSWSDVRAQSFIENYRNQTTVEQRERYPNVDWQEVLFKDFAMSYNANIGISGGTKFVKYFVSADYANEGDQFEHFDNGRGYEAAYAYNRMNVRANLDFQITPTTTFSMNLSGSNGIRKHPQENAGDEFELTRNWAGVYGLAPDVFMPVYSDGAWGYYPNNIQQILNSARRMSVGGIVEDTNTRINTDFTLVQKLDFITEGLQARGSISWDNNFSGSNGGINDMFNDPQQKWIDPLTGIAQVRMTETNDKFDWAEGIAWGTNDGSVGSVSRNLFYQLQLNWARTFGQHALSAMGVFNRQENASGAMIPSYREDWAFRATYDFAGKYMVEYNGAYNGSEKFSRENRFAFFNSGAVGWMISEEQFMKQLTFLDMLKVRYSYGEIGDDNVGGRFLYVSSAVNSGSVNFGNPYGSSPYTWWREDVVGNPNVRWETVVKQNFGIDYSFLNGMFAGTVEIFKDKRRDILVSGSQRSIPAYLGISAPVANLGKVETNGYEIELRFNKSLNNGMRLWANMNMTHATSNILERDDPQLRPEYQKQAGFPMGQVRTHIDGGFLNTYDQIYGSAQLDANDQNKLPGDYNLIDFNNDGLVDSKDSVPFGYSTTPENTYNATLGIDWKGFSAFVQFYGVNNVTREVPLASFGGRQNIAYNIGSWWSETNPNGDATVPRWLSTASSYRYSTQFLYDGSYLRLKNAEIGYTFTSGWVKKLGMGNLKVYVNGNNLWLWTKMPDDRESNLGSSGGNGAYPTVRRFNLGVRFTL